MAMRLSFKKKSKKRRVKKRSNAVVKPFRSGDEEQAPEPFDIMKMFPSVRNGQRIEQAFDPETAGLNCFQLEGSLQSNLEHFLQIFSSSDFKASNIELDETYHNIHLKFDYSDIYSLNIMAQLSAISNDECAVEFTRSRGTLGTMDHFNKVI